MTPAPGGGARADGDGGAVDGAVEIVVGGDDGDGGSGGAGGVPSSPLETGRPPG